MSLCLLNVLLVVRCTLKPRRQENKRIYTKSWPRRPTYRYVVEEEAEASCWFGRWRRAVSSQDVARFVAVVFRVDYWRALRQSWNRNTVMCRSESHNRHTSCIMTGIQLKYWPQLPNMMMAADSVQIRGHWTVPRSTFHEYSSVSILLIVPHITETRWSILRQENASFKCKPFRGIWIDLITLIQIKYIILQALPTLILIHSHSFRDKHLFTVTHFPVALHKSLVKLIFNRTNLPWPKWYHFFITLWNKVTSMNRTISSKDILI